MAKVIAQKDKDGQENKRSLTPEDISFILNELRRASIKWKGRAECLRLARKKVLEGHSKKTGLPIYKLYWQCAACKKWERDEKNMEVDHIEEIGPFKGSFDVHIPRIFCSQENLQALCYNCHLKKTKKYHNARAKWERKKKS